MAWLQKEIVLRPQPRGFHLVTDEILRQLPEVGSYRVGLVPLFLLHTSAALAISENADPTVRTDMLSYFNQAVPEETPYYRHTLEGPDDMPTPIKSVLLGSSLTIPLAEGRLRLGTRLILTEFMAWGGVRRWRGDGK